MGESPLEEFEAHEHAEHAQHAAHGNDPLISQVTFTIAVLAVVAAISASLETTEGDKAIVTKNEAVLEQNQASDTWAFYQAKSLKKNLYAIAADQGGPKAADYAKESARNGAEQGPIREHAQRYLDDPQLVRNIVADGCERARKLAEETMRDVRSAMGIDYS